MEEDFEEKSLSPLVAEGIRDAAMWLDMEPVEFLKTMVNFGMDPRMFSFVQTEALEGGDACSRAQQIAVFFLLIAIILATFAAVLFGAPRAAAALDGACLRASEVCVPLGFDINDPNDFQIILRTSRESCDGGGGNMMMTPASMLAAQDSACGQAAGILRYVEGFSGTQVSLALSRVGSAIASFFSLLMSVLFGNRVGQFGSAGAAVASRDYILRGLAGMFRALWNLAKQICEYFKGRENVRAAVQAQGGRLIDLVLTASWRSYFPSEGGYGRTSLPTPLDELFAEAGGEAAVQEMQRSALIDVSPGRRLQTPQVVKGAIRGILEGPGPGTLDVARIVTQTGLSEQRVLDLIRIAIYRNARADPNEAVEATRTFFRDPVVLSRIRDAVEGAPPPPAAAGAGRRRARSQGRGGGAAGGQGGGAAGGGGGGAAGGGVGGGLEGGNDSAKGLEGGDTRSTRIGFVAFGMLFLFMFLLRHMCDIVGFRVGPSSQEDLVPTTFNRELMGGVVRIPARGSWKPVALVADSVGPVVSSAGNFASGLLDTLQEGANVGSRNLGLESPIAIYSQLSQVTSRRGQLQGLLERWKDAQETAISLRRKIISQYPQFAQMSLPAIIDALSVSESSSKSVALVVSDGTAVTTEKRQFVVQQINNTLNEFELAKRELSTFLGNPEINLEIAAQREEQRYEGQSSSAWNSAWWWIFGGGAGSASVIVYQMYTGNCCSRKSLQVQSENRSVYKIFSVSRGSSAAGASGQRRLVAVEEDFAAAENIRTSLGADSHVVEGPEQTRVWFIVSVNGRMSQQIGGLFSSEDGARAEYERLIQSVVMRTCKKGGATLVSLPMVTQRVTCWAIKTFIEKNPLGFIDVLTRYFLELATRMVDDGFTATINDVWFAPVAIVANAAIAFAAVHGSREELLDLLPWNAIE